LRIVEITGMDTQADGGTHVKNTREIGKIGILNLENKGAKNKRIYFTLRE
ncbi:MAG: alanyl-tRNA editing protein AlaX, partial [Candidatus Micrarchaeota archaeon]